MHYRKIWELANNKNIPDGCEIHHIDGDKSNNDPSNLKCVTVEEHLQIHLEQEDWGAVQAILARTKSDKNLIKLAASRAQKERYNNGTHNWLIHKDKQKVKVKEMFNKRISETGNAFLGIEDRVENSRKGGQAAAEKKAGFLDTNASHHGSKAVKGTSWWCNKDGKLKRSVNCPGPGWCFGMKYKEELICPQ